MENRDRMNFDPALLQRLNDRQLADLVSQIASAAGADRSRTQELLGNLDALRNGMQGLTAEQAKQLLDRAGEDKSRAIYDILRRQQNGKG